MRHPARLTACALHGSPARTLIAVPLVLAHELTGALLDHVLPEDGA